MSIFFDDDAAAPMGGDDAATPATPDAPAEGGETPAAPEGDAPAAPAEGGDTPAM